MLENFSGSFGAERTTWDPTWRPMMVYIATILTVVWVFDGPESGGEEVNGWGLWAWVTANVAVGELRGSLERVLSHSTATVAY